MNTEVESTWRKAVGDNGVAISYVGCWKEGEKHDKRQSGEPATPVMLVQMFYSCSQKRL